MIFLVRTVLFLELVLLACVSQSHAARIEPWNKPCLKEQEKWKKLDSYKAVAVTKVYKNGQGCGHSWGYPTRADAKNVALRRCQIQLKKNQPKSKDRCMIIFVK
jgi:hypothetical protein